MLCCGDVTFFFPMQARAWHDLGCSEVRKSPGRFVNPPSASDLSLLFLGGWVPEVFRCFGVECASWFACLDSHPCGRRSESRPRMVHVHAQGFSHTQCLRGITKWRMAFGSPGIFGTGTAQSWLHTGMLAVGTDQLIGCVWCGHPGTGWCDSCEAGRLPPTGQGSGGGQGSAFSNPTFWKSFGWLLSWSRWSVVGRL